jgi:hypothetical protein
METFFGVLVPISLFIGLFTMIVFLRKYENDERMAMIEKGMEPGVRKKSNGFGTLRFALLAIGVGLGILVAFLILQAIPVDPESLKSTLQVIDDEHIEYNGGDGIGTAIYMSNILIFGGLGLLSAYLIARKQKKLEQ